MVWYDYQWFVIVGGIFSFIMSWCIGANDVANSFATAIGSKTLTLFQACCIAAVLEFSGAIALGGEVTKTIAGSITDTSLFESNPEIFAYGMLCSLISASLWVFMASYFSLAVSTTHSIIGSVIGFTLVWKGNDGIIWYASIDEFPYVKGLIPIIISWITSPVMSAVLCTIIFLPTKYILLKNIIYVRYAFPVIVFVTIFINMFFILYKGAKAELSWDANKAAWVSSIIASGSSVLSSVILMIYKKFKTNTIEIPSHQIETEESQTENHNIENMFKYFQVISSCSVAFAHGANDVANAIGPYAAIWYVYNNREIISVVDTPKWMLVLGGAGIVVGLSTYGYNVIKALGGQLCKLSPSRGYSAELATALTVSFASVYGIPVSTTHCIVGAEVGIGMLENVKTGVNWFLLGKTVMAWIMTLFISGVLSALFFSQGVYAPSMQMMKIIHIYEDNIKQMVNISNKSVEASLLVEHLNTLCFNQM